MKKISIFGLAAVLSVGVLVAGCSSSTGSNTAAPTGSSANINSSAAPKATSQGGATTTIKVGYPAPQDSPVDQGAHKWADLVSKDSNGKVKIELYPASQLGGEAQMMQNLNVGALDCGIIGDLAFTQYAPTYAGLSTPYLFRNVDHLHKVLYGSMGQDINKEFQKNLNSQVLDWWDRGPREITANKEIIKPEDLKGLKIRTPEIPLIVESFKALGANPTPMSFDQVFNALQQHVIDAQENPLDLIYTTKFNEVQKYVIMTDHQIVPWIVLMNNDKFNSLPQDLQKIVKDDASKAGDDEKALTQKLISDYKQKLTAAGMKIVTVDNTLFSKKLEESKVTDKFAAKWVPNLLQTIRDTK